MGVEAGQMVGTLSLGIYIYIFFNQFSIIIVETSFSLFAMTHQQKW